MLSEYQWKRRLKLEKTLVYRKLPQYTFHDYNSVKGSAYFRGKQKCSITFTLPLDPVIPPPPDPIPITPPPTLYKDSLVGISWYYPSYDPGISFYFSDRQDYELEVHLSRDYPDEMPKLYVISPTSLPKHGNQGTVNSCGLSHDFHTRPNGPNGCVQICHFHSSAWVPQRPASVS